MSGASLLNSLTHPQPEVFIKEFLGSDFGTEKKRRIFLRLAIQYALAFNNYVVALLCSALLQEKSIYIPSLHYQLGASIIEKLARENPNLQLAFNEELFITPEIPNDFIETFSSLAEKIQHLLILFAIGADTFPVKYSGLKKSLLTYCDRESGDDNLNLQRMLLLLLSHCQTDEFISLVRNMLSADSELAIDNKHRDALICTLFANPIRTDVLTPNDMQNAFMHMLRETARKKNVKETHVTQLQTYVFYNQHQLTQVFRYKSLHEQPTRISQLMSIGYYLLPLMLQWLFDQNNKLEHLCQLMEEKKCPVKRSHFVQLDFDGLLTYFELDIRAKNLAVQLPNQSQSEMTLSQVARISTMCALPEFAMPIGMAAKPDRITPLPYEVINLIKEHLPLEDVCRFNMTCWRVRLSNKSTKERLKRSPLSEPQPGTEQTQLAQLSELMSESLWKFAYTPKYKLSLRVSCLIFLLGFMVCASYVLLCLHVLRQRAIPAAHFHYLSMIRVSM